MRRAASFLLARARHRPASGRAVSSDAATPTSPSSTTATSLAAALAAPRGSVTTLDLAGAEGAADVTCVNLMCEKLGDPCVCRLAGALEKLARRGVVEVKVSGDVGGVLREGGVVPEGVRVVVVEE